MVNGPWFRQDRVHRWLVDNGPATAPAIGKAMGMTTCAATKMLWRMEATGSVQRSDHLRGQIWVALDVTPVDRRPDANREKVFASRPSKEFLEMRPSRREGAATEIPRIPSLAEAMAAALREPCYYNDAL